MIELETTNEWQNIPPNESGEIILFCWPLKKPIYFGESRDLKEEVGVYNILFGEALKKVGATIILNFDSDRLFKYVKKRKDRQLLALGEGAKGASGGMRGRVVAQGTEDGN